jgi:hypothetical protein
VAGPVGLEGDLRHLAVIDLADKPGTCHPSADGNGTGRPLLVEDELRAADRRLRIARLYLPLGNDGGTPDGVLCGVARSAENRYGPGAFSGARRLRPHRD